MPDTCSTCGSSLGFYDGPNGKPRCLHCFYETEVPDEGPAPDPVSTVTSRAVEDKAEAGPRHVHTTESMAGGVRDKAVRGPKEPGRR